MSLYNPSVCFISLVPFQLDSQLSGPYWDSLLEGWDNNDGDVEEIDVGNGFFSLRTKPRTPKP